MRESKLVCVRLKFNTTRFGFDMMTVREDDGERVKRVAALSS